MQQIDNREASYQRAKKRTEALRKFYKHLIIYVVVNFVISVYKVDEYLDRGYSFEDALWNIDTLAVWIVWGIFVLLQAFRTFNPNTILGTDWEERKIREYMDNNKH